MPEMISFKLRLPETVHQWLKEKSERTGISINSLILLELQAAEEREKRYINQFFNTD